jgi:hypothetical protein
MTLQQQKRLHPIADSDEVIEVPSKRYRIVNKQFESFEKFKAELYRQKSTSNKPYWRKLSIIEVQTEDGLDCKLQCEDCNSFLSAKNPSEAGGRHFAKRDGYYVCKAATKKQQEREASMQKAGESSYNPW